MAGDFSEAIAGGRLQTASSDAEQPADRAGAGLGAVVGTGVMALLFGIVIVPLGLAMRLAGRDRLGLRRDPNAGTYWVERRSAGPPRATMARQF